MGGDYSRLRFDRAKHYAGVRLQQGRVLLDSDLNEAGEIAAHLSRTLVRDVLGPFAFPGAGDGTGGFTVTTDGSTVTIGAGHAWIDGLLCENETAVDAEAQPDLPGARLPTKAGTYLFYLDVWQREVTAAEDPSLLEPALGGTDTAVRVATVWQIRWARASKDGDRRGRGRAGRRRLPADTTDARLAVRGGYVGTEGRLYRVEVHDGGRPGTATFKWSRDNGSTVAAVRSWGARELELRRPPRAAFRAGDRLELVDRIAVLDRRPGLFLEIEAVDGDTVRPTSSSPDLPASLLAPLVRRWDGGPRTIDSAASPGWVPLEDGVEVRFDGRRYRTGDHWLFSTRTAVGDQPAGVEWPASGGEPDARPPDGVHQHRCPLALLRYDEGGWRLLRDLRRRRGRPR